MTIRVFRVLALALMFGAAGAPARAMPIQSSSCTLTADGSSVQIRVVSDGSERRSCVFSCHVKVAGQSAFQGFKCNGIVIGPGEQLICELEGDGPEYFSEARPDRFDCHAN
jgi:hypothetical protein